MTPRSLTALLVLAAAFGIRAHADAQPRPTAPMVTRTQRFAVPLAFGPKMNERITRGAQSMTKADLLDKFDPAQRIPIRGGKTIAIQELVDRVGRAEDQMRQNHTSLTSLPLKRGLDPAIAANLVKQKQRVGADKARVAALKAGGWANGMVEHASPDPSPAPPTSGSREAFTLKTGPNKAIRRVNPYPCAVGGDFNACIPTLDKIDAPWDSGSVGDTSMFAASTQLSVSSAMGNGGDLATCSMTWNVNGWAFNNSIGLLSLNGSASTNARSQTFGGTIGINIVGQTASLGGDDEGDASWSIHQDASVSAGGKIPLLGPLYVQLTFDASASFDAKLIGERTSAAGVGVKGFNGTSDIAFNGAHCHVGVEPSIDSKIGGGIGLGIGISDLVDILNISVLGEAHPLTAKLPANVTLDVLRAPPSGSVGFDAHLAGSIMSSKVWVHYQFFDVCVDALVGTVCIVHDIFGLPTSGDITVYEDGGVGYDDDLVGGTKIIQWKGRPVPQSVHR